MPDRDRPRHEIAHARDGLGYCMVCDDWHDLEALSDRGDREALIFVPPLLGAPLPVQSSRSGETR